jgi:hypothetical protein
MKRTALLFTLLMPLMLSSTTSCLTVINPVTFALAADATTLPARPDGCFVEVSDENTPPTRPYQIVGRLTLDWDATRMREQGEAGALKTLKSSACEYGGHFVMNMRALPRGFAQGVIYEADLAVLLDEQGHPVIGTQTNTASSSAEVTGTSPASP